MKKQEWVLFGTGKIMPFYRSMLYASDENVGKYTDNDRKKWNQTMDGVQVIPPYDLEKDSYNIVISCVREQEIREQLRMMGISREHIFNYERLFHYYVDKLVLNHPSSNGSMAKEQGEILSEKIYGREPAILIDAYDGVGWGGMELWSYRVAEGLRNRGHDVAVYGAAEQKRQPEWEHFIHRFPYDHEHVDCWWSAIPDFVRSMEKKVPFTLINNWSAQVLGAALVIKRWYPNLVRIVTVVHNDADFLYRRIAEFAEDMDAILCVSGYIKEKLKKRYALPPQKLHSRMNFINWSGSLKRNLRKETEPLRIGWGGRLEVIQKRADLIPKLILNLDTKGIHYRMEIAGNGDYKEELAKWIEENGKEDQIHLLGYISPKNMHEFWSRQHIYFNLSDYEGSSFAMLEAMSCGAVPVVKEVSGAAEIVTNGENGFVVPLDRIEEIAGRIYLLDQDEGLRRRFSTECQQRIIQNCRFDDYMDYMEELIFAGGCDDKRTLSSFSR